MRFGADYYPEHWPRERWETDARLMIEAGLELVRLAEFAWSRLEPAEDRFDFAWLDDALEVLGRAGLKAVLGTPSAAPPAWLIERYPEALPVREDGTRLGFGGRHHDCQSNPDYRARVAAVIRAMAEHYKDHPHVIGWQTDNELGNSHLNVCTCDTCRAGFHEWLERKYGTIEALNEAWGTAFWSQTYSSFAQIPAPRPTPNSHSPSLRLDWRRFTSDLVVGFQGLQVAILREVCPKHFVTHNFMGLFDKPDYFELAKELDFVSHDQYPIGFWTEQGALPDPADLAIKLDFVRGLKRRTYWIMEQQAGPAGWDLIGATPRPGQLRLWAAQSIAHGADTVVYFRWRTCLFGTEEYWHGILPHSGKPGRRYEEVKRTAKELSPIMDRIQGKAPRADAAILFSYDQSWANQIQPHHPELKYREHIRTFYKALHQANIPVDFVSPASDLSAYKLLIAPMLFLTRPELVARLDAWVRAGGRPGAEPPFRRQGLGQQGPRRDAARSLCRDARHRDPRLRLPAQRAAGCAVVRKRFSRHQRGGLQVGRHRRAQRGRAAGALHRRLLQGDAGDHAPWPRQGQRGVRGYGARARDERRPPVGPRRRGRRTSPGRDAGGRRGRAQARQRRRLHLCAQPHGSRGARRPPRKLGAFDRARGQQQRRAGASALRDRRAAEQEVKRFLDAKTLRGPFEADDGAQPNIILISVDMVPPEFYREHRAPWNAPMRTPALERLRRDGATFANAFCASPLCTPSRAAYLTGRMAYITTNGERAHDGHLIELRAHDPIFPAYLKAAGYHARHVGKCHVGGAHFLEVFGENDSPWDRWSPPWYDDDQYVGFLAARGLGRYEFSRRITGRDAAGRDTQQRPGGNFYGGWLAEQGGRPFPPDATYPAYLVDRALTALDARRDPGRPLYLQLDFFEPHQPFAVPGGMEEREGEIRAAIGLPESYRRLQAKGFRADWAEPRVYRMYRANWGLTDPATALDYRVANQLEFEHVDAVIGRFLDGLADRGLYDSSWVFFLADHGEMNAELALLDKGAYLRPQVIRAPLVVKPPAGSVIGRGSVVEAPASLLDLAPTVLEIAGIRTHDACDGLSLLDLTRLGRRPADRPVLCDVWSHVVPNPCIGTVFESAGRGLHLFSFNAADDIDELYELGGESEAVNVCDDPAKAQVRSEAVGLMDRLLGADPRWVGYSHAFRLDYGRELPEAGGDRQLFQ